MNWRNFAKKSGGSLSGQSPKTAAIWRQTWVWLSLRLYDTPEDKIVFDVGHQSYVHKMITGRYEQFGTLRKYGGISGFPKREESEYDCFETGHASTAISAALGLARARDFRKEKYLITPPLLHQKEYQRWAVDG